MKTRKASLFALSCALGFLICIAFPLSIGWIGGKSYYLYSFFLSGIILGLAARRLIWLWPIGVIIGLLIYPTWLFVVQEPSPVILIWLTGAIIYYPCCLLGSAIGVFIRRRFLKNS